MSSGKTASPSTSSVTSTSTVRSKTPPTVVNATFKSKVEEAVIKSKEPIKSNETQQIQANKEKGVWLNRCETCAWKSDVPLSEYPINDDPCPCVIKKKSKKIDQTQKIAIRYLKPPTPPAPGPIIVRREANKPTAPAPPLVIRQEALRAKTPPVLVIREAPPPPPPVLPPKTITIPGKRLPAPPRKVVIERLPAEPAKPQTVIIERWLPYQQPKRKVIFQPAPPDPVVCKPKNVIVQWDSADVCVSKDVEHLGVVNVDPCEYSQRYSSVLKSVNEFPEELKSLPTHQGVELAANQKASPAHELEGDLDALKLVDLDAEGLGMYKHLVRNNACNKFKSPSAPDLESPGSFAYVDSMRNGLPSILCITTCNTPLGEEFYKRYDFVDHYQHEFFY